MNEFIGGVDSYVVRYRVCHYEIKFAFDVLAYRFFLSMLCNVWDTIYYNKNIRPLLRIEKRAILLPTGNLPKPRSSSYDVDLEQV